MILKKLHLFILLLYIPIYGKSFSLADSTARHHSIKPAFDFDQRFSFIRSQPVNIWGQRIGIIINDKFKIGIGGYFLNQRLHYIYSDDYYAKRKLVFGTFYFEPYLVRRKYWEISIVTEAGFGQSYFKVYESKDNALDTTEIRNFFPTGAGLSLSFKLPAFFGCRPFRWFGINFLAGYRYDLVESIFGTHYDGAYWSVSGAVFLDRVTDDIHYWKNKKRQRKQAIKNSA